MKKASSRPTLVVATDFSPASGQALRWGITYALRAEARLVLLHFNEVEDNWGAGFFTETHHNDEIRKFHRYVQEHVSSELEGAHYAGGEMLEFKPLILESFEKSKLRAVLLQERADLLLLGYHTDGTSALELAGDMPCSTMLVPENALSTPPEEALLAMHPDDPLWKTRRLMRLLASTQIEELALFHREGETPTDAAPELAKELTQANAVKLEGVKAAEEIINYCRQKIEDARPTPPLLVCFGPKHSHLHEQFSDDLVAEIAEDGVAAVLLLNTPEYFFDYKNFTNMDCILVPTDFSDYAKNALNYAVELARKTGAELLIHHCFVPPAAPGGNYLAYKKLLEVEEQTSQREMTAFVEHLKGETYEDGTHLNVKTLITKGTPVEEISEVAKTEGVALVVMGTLGASGIEEVFLGSNTASVIQEVRCPVMAVPEKATFSGFQSMVYASVQDAEDEHVLALLSDLSELFGGNVEYLHISKDVVKFMDEKKQLEALEKKYENLPFDKIKFKLVIRDDEDTTEEALMQHLKQKRADLLVMLTHRRNFFQRLFHRSLTQKMAYHSEVPLLILKSK